MGDLKGQPYAVKVDGETVHLFFGVHAAAALEGLHPGKSFDKILVAMEETPTMTGMQQFVWSCMVLDQPDATLRDAAGVLEAALDEGVDDLLGEVLKRSRLFDVDAAGNAPAPGKGAKKPERPRPKPAR